MTFSYRAFYFAAISIATMRFSQVTGNLVVGPVNRVALVGQSFQFDCSTDDRISVNWLHYPHGSRTPRDVYISRTVVNSYNPRFTVHREELANNVTAYNLLITDVRMEDAGKYQCVGWTGMGEKRDAELTVLGSHPNCTTNIGPNGFICENDCHHPIDEIRTSCSIEYTGNIAPQMQWKTTSGQDTIQPQPITKVSEKTEKTVSSELNIVATKSLDGASVVWYSTQLTQINWTSTPIKILYAKQNLSPVILSQSQIVTCSANSSQHCSYTWTVKMETGESQTIKRQTLEVSQPGTYLCHAHCPLHQQSCTVIALHVEYKNGDEYSLNLSWVIGVGIGLLVVALVIVIICKWKGHRASDSPPSAKKNGLLQSMADKLCPCLRETSDSKSSSSNNGSSQSGSDEEKALHVKNSNSDGIC